MNNEPENNGNNQSDDNVTNRENVNPVLRESDVVNREDNDVEDTDKYLAMEQQGVQYTQDTDPIKNSDHSDYSNPDDKDEWSEDGGNSKNSEAFNQDDYILDDNIDLDEDQNQSISSDDEDFEESNERYTN